MLLALLFGRFFCSTAPQAFFRPDRDLRGRRAQGLSRLDASSRPPLGLALTDPSTAACLSRWDFRWLVLQAGSGFFLFGGAPPQTVTLEFNTMGVVDEAIQYRIAEGGIGNDVVPLRHRDLACD